MTSEKHRELTPVQIATLEVILASVEATDLTRQQSAEASSRHDDALMRQADSKSMAHSEAEQLANRMLAIDRRRFVPFLGKAGIKLGHANAGRHKAYERLWLPKVDITTPLLFATESGDVDEVPIVTGWRATTHTIGSDLKDLASSVSPKSPDVDRTRKCTGLSLEFVVQNPDGAGRNPIESVTTYEFYELSPTYLSPKNKTPHPDLDDNDSFYFEQYRTLRAIHQTLTVGK